MSRDVALATIVVMFASVLSLSAEETKPPKDVVEIIEFYDGNWSVEGNEGDKPLRGKASFRVPAGSHCLIGTVNARVGEEPLIFSLVSAWDSTTGWYTEQGAGHDGTVYRIEWQKAAAKVDEGQLTGTVDGKKYTENVRLERKGQNDFVVDCTERVVGDERLPDLRLVYQRIVKEKRRPKPKK
jgi:hypothetical protein